MTFSLQMKRELLENKPLRVRYKLAHAYGLFLFGRAFSPEEVSLHTENEETVRLFQWLAGSLLGRETPIARGEKRRGDKTVYMVGLTEEEDRRRLLELFGGAEGINRGLFSTQEELGAFLAGAYLACGNITDPEKTYHMEFVVRSKALCRELAATLEETVAGVKTSTRRGNSIAYYKECGPIEDLMTLMGATRSCFQIIDIEMVKSIRNRANRAVNCETANIDKMVSASTSQVEDIELILAAKGESGLPEPLLQVARLRLENPTSSLRELVELSDVTISRSGLHNRLDKIAKIAEGIRAGRGTARDN
jgi:DNA-binding protein WhiA